MWEIIQPLLPDRLVLDSVFYVLRSGCQWRILPRDLMPWDAAHRWFTKWRRDDTWDTASTTSFRELRQRLRDLPSSDADDRGYRRPRYLRYADDTLFGFAGPKAGRP